jgi:hypothetical protein
MMPDFGSPIAQNVNVDPLKTLSSMLSIKQQQQALQSGQLTIQGQQQSLQGQNAEVQQKQQQNKELQALAQFTAKAVSDPAYKNSDGTPNVQKYQQDAMAVAPTYGQAYIGNATTNFKEAIANRSALLALNSQQQAELGQGLAAVAATPGANREDLMNVVQQLRAKNQDPAYQRMIDSALLSFPNTSAMPDDQASMALRQHAGMMAQGVGGLAPQLPQGTTNAAGQIINRAPVTGQLSSAPVSSGNSGINPGSPQVAAATAAGTSRATGIAGSDIDRANQVSALTQPSKAMVQSTQQIDALTDQISSGKLSKVVSEAAAAMGYKGSDGANTYARQILNKDLAQVRTQFSSSAGSDARAATILGQFPDATSDPQTIHTAMDYVRGVAKQNLARSALLNSYRTKNPDLAGFQHADDALTGTVDPLMAEFKSLKTQQQQTDFYARNFGQDRAAMYDFRNRVAGANHVLGQ